MRVWGVWGVAWRGRALPQNCNFHCSTAGKGHDHGEVAAVLRPGMAPCKRPAPSPSPSPSPPAPAGPIPADWVAREAASNMYIAENEPMVLGNGFVAAMTHTGIMNVAGVFTGYLPPRIAGEPAGAGVAGQSQRPGQIQPQRAAIPSFWDGYEIGGATGDYAAGLDVGVSAVYSIGMLPGRASVVARKYAHRGLPHVMGVDFTFNNSAGAEALESNISQPGSWGSSNATIGPPAHVPGTAWAHDPSAAAPGMVCWTGKVMQSEDPSLPLINLGLCSTDLRSTALPVSVPAGHSKTYSVVAALYSTLDGASPVALAAKDFAAAAAVPAEARWGSHVAAVGQALGSGIEVTGNHDLSKLVNASLHMLVASLRPEPEYWYSSSPGGLATNCYSGHTFWDMETWMYPNLLFFHPDLAQGTVMYRVKGLRWAEQWARSTGRAGARYPWQTAGTGRVASYANEDEIHIVGDVALSMWQYYAATLNRTWLKAHGLPVLAATADFFAAWAQPNADGSFSLKQTQGPDEFHTGDDSCYVNAAAALTLRNAANFSTMLGLPHPANWTDIAAKVRLPFDATNQRHLEFAEWTDSMKAKQADTIMLSYPFGVDMPSTVRKNDLDYYAAHTGNGPSMTWSMYVPSSPPLCCCCAVVGVVRWGGLVCVGVVRWGDSHRLCVPRRPLLYAPTRPRKITEPALAVQIN